MISQPTQPDSERASALGHDLAYRVSSVSTHSGTGDAHALRVDYPDLLANQCAVEVAVAPEVDDRRVPLLGEMVLGKLDAPRGLPVLWG